MSESNSVYVFKGPSEDQFRDMAKRVVSDLGGRLEWEIHPDPSDARMTTSHKDSVHAAYIHLKGYEVANQIGLRLAIPWINVRIQEGALWDYSLYSGDTHLDNFSTLPEYWGDDEDEDEDKDEQAEWVATQRGKPDVLANVWQIEQPTIENYLKPWGYVSIDDGSFDTTLRGKAYAADQCEYGDIWQMTDFLRAMGAHDPNFVSPHCVARYLEFPRK